MTETVLDTPNTQPDVRPDALSPDEIAQVAEVVAAESGVFAELKPALVAALAEQGITSPTAVQSAVIPDGLSGRDVLGRAQTGSGKTLAFGIPVLERLAGRSSRPRHPRAVIIVPTRELATQVTRSLAPLARAVGLKLTTVYGGVPYERQTRQLRQRADIVVATPGRLEDLLEKGHCSFDDIELTILDEADHLCDLGFYPAVDKLVSRTPDGSQRMLLSATLDGDVDALVRAHLRKPQLHELDPSAGAVTTMTHHTLVVGGFREKVAAVVDLVQANGRTIVFTRTRDGAVELAQALEGSGVPAVDLHGDLSQRVRERNLARFSSGGAQAVVATDVAARGIHVDGVNLVVHFDAASDPKAYLHRSGRTARAGTDGAVVTITTPKFAQAVARLQQGAAVEVRQHDIRTAPRPMTAAALGESGEIGTTKFAGGGGGGARSGGPRRSGGGSRSGGHRSAGSSRGSYGDRPARSGGYQGKRPAGR
ncbi:DEAD/DEAH box helicase [Nocardioides alkalitolerans]|uniref:DEAD/DEAH box helicase n=1 Tax=Nocardioides alkalitolerans TaxID=281714 RepID=UPI000424319E|nr:DEAD/DEAH box helicase [Nocardioides alkalitolerans]